jgi:CHRD domain
MRRTWSSVGVALVVSLVALTIVTTGMAGGAPQSATLSGAAEVPGPGDPDGSGSASLQLNPGQGEICYELTVANIAPATAAHIHVAAAGVAGPVVVPLAPPTSGSSSACAAVDRDLVLAILKNPAGYYVNVHNAEFPAGAVRGQLSLP